MSEGGCASAASGDLRSGAPHTILSYPIYLSILSYPILLIIWPKPMRWYANRWFDRSLGVLSLDFTPMSLIIYACTISVLLTVSQVIKSLNSSHNASPDWVIATVPGQNVPASKRPLTKTYLARSKRTRVHVETYPPQHSIPYCVFVHCQVELNFIIRLCKIMQLYCFTCSLV